MVAVHVYVLFYLYIYIAPTSFSLSPNTLSPFSLLFLFLVHGYGIVCIHCGYLAWVSCVKCSRGVLTTSRIKLKSEPAELIQTFTEHPGPWRSCSVQQRTILQTLETLFWGVNLMCVKQRKKRYSSNVPWWRKEGELWSENELFSNTDKMWIW